MPFEGSRDGQSSPFQFGWGNAEESFSVSGIAIKGQLVNGDDNLMVTVGDGDDDDVDNDDVDDDDNDVHHVN